MANAKIAAYEASPIKFGQQLTDPQQILTILEKCFVENDEDNSGGLVSESVAAQRRHCNTVSLGTAQLSA